MLKLNNTLEGYLKNVEILGNTTQDSNDLTDIRSVGDKVEGQELYNISLQLDSGDGVIDVVEILSPVQLEKVDDVVDKIVCKSGVWGVDKKVIAEVQNGVLVNTKSEPQFIPLPHDQQVKLRTFSGKTNISFLTEIKGTIKAQVPKSLGAVVNTHTEQISNLNKELDRVKKLEGSTVSTVETESNFTTVEQTSNGYFEGVKLEGKTLVNNCLENKSAIRAISDSGSKYVSYNVRAKASTEYTVVINISKNTSSGSALHKWGVYLDGATQGDVNINPESTSFITIPGSTGIYCVKFTSKAKLINKPCIVIGLHSSWGTYEIEVRDVMLLEGDHTNNPPEYFEGLMSIGEDINDITIKSVNENLFDESSLNDYIINSGEDSFTLDYGKMYHNYKYNLKPNNQLTFSYICKETIGGNKNPRFQFLYDGSYTDIHPIITNTFEKYEKASLPNKKLIGIKAVFGSSGGNWVIKKNSIMLNTGAISKEFVPHKSNKKRVLYYNEVTQTWEKPILREWDSIEKHTDGKYYYHVRSIAVDYVQGDENVVDCITDMTKTVKKTSSEKVYECTNIDLLTYENETNYIIESGAIAPKSILKVHNNISNVVKLLQEKVSLLENTFIQGLKSVLSGDMYSLATILYPEDFTNDNTEHDIMVIPE